MRLLVDTDAFCKLGLVDVITDAAALFGVEIRECGRLAALPHMLRRGSLPRLYGRETCEELLTVVDDMPAVSQPAGPWLERLTPIPDIDPGEAILFSVAADLGLPVISGDLRALHPLKDVEGFPDALAGRVIILEAVVLGLCHALGPELVRQRVEPLRDRDKVVAICFSPANHDPEECLRSYLQTRKAELSPLVLWDPRPGEEE